VIVAVARGERAGSSNIKHSSGGGGEDLRGQERTNVMTMAAFTDEIRDLVQRIPVIRAIVVLCCAIAIATVVRLPSMTLAADAPKSGKAASSKQIERGRYLSIVGGCNDCHTSGFAPRDGQVPESEWLMGAALGFSGPWGTTYAPNLRLTVSRMTEAQWVPYAKALRTRPPMPWFTFNKWSDPDLRALYQYIKSLQPVGSPAPSYVPPDKQAPPPFIQWPAPPK